MNNQSFRYSRQDESTSESGEIFSRYNLDNKKRPPSLYASVGSLENEKACLLAQNSKARKQQIEALDDRSSKCYYDLAKSNRGP